METYGLFEDQSASQILCTFFATDPRDDPLRLSFPDIEDLQVRNSARNGCMAAYQILRSRGQIAGDARFFLSCQFAEDRINTNAHGGSAGLAFCLQFASQAYQFHRGRSLGFTVAATGVIVDGTAKARVEGVRGINRKLAVAVELLKEGDWVFYPQVNEEEIEPALRQQATQQGLHLMAVSTVEQALGALLPEPRRTRRVWWLAPVLLAAGLLAYYLTNRPDPQSLAALAIQAQEAGHYLEAREHVAQLAPALSHQLLDSLHLELKFHYQTPLQKGVLPFSPGPVRIALNSGDRYRLSCAARDSCYLYAYQLDSGGKLSPLAGPVLLRPDHTCFLPPEAGQWFVLDERTGEELLYVVAARRPGRDLEELSRQLVGAPAAGKEELKGRLLERLAARAQASQAGIAGVFCETFKFQHR